MPARSRVTRPGRGARRRARSSDPPACSLPARPAGRWWMPGNPRTPSAAALTNGYFGRAPAGPGLGPRAAARDARRPCRGPVLAREPAVRQPLEPEPQVQRIPRIAGPPASAGLGHDLGRGQDVRRTGDGRVGTMHGTAPIGPDEAPVRAPTQEPAVKQQGRRSLQPLRLRPDGRASSRRPRAPAAGSRSPGRTSIAPQATVAVPAAVGPLPHDQPLHQPGRALVLKPQPDRGPDCVALLGGAAPDPIRLADHDDRRGRFRVLRPEEPAQHLLVQRHERGVTRRVAEDRELNQRPVWALPLRVGVQRDRPVRRPPHRSARARGDAGMAARTARSPVRPRDDPAPG